MVRSSYSPTQGAFRFTGTLDQLTGLPAAQCKALFTNGSALTDWVFDKDYAGGGSVVPFTMRCSIGKTFDALGAGLA